MTSTRYRQLEYQLQFLTPAFLGNAKQSGQWRTPPIKALLRQWWRVAVAEEMSFDVNAIRKREGELFGTAADGGNSRKSQVRIRLDSWSEGKLNKAPDINHVFMGKNRIPGSLYLGYGPVVPGPKLKSNAAIQSGETATIRLAFPEDSKLEYAIGLMNSYGTLGGRSRNGWGSFELSGDTDNFKVPTRSWLDAMGLDWAHALGTDETGALLWCSEPQKNWEGAMKLLAQTRVDMRRAVPERLLLAYPSTKMSIHEWSNQSRVPHSIRFKVRKHQSGYVAVVFHMPCRPAEELWRKLPPQRQKQLIPSFVAAHAFMDKHNDFKRSGV